MVRSLVFALVFVVFAQSFAEELPSDLKKNAELTLLGIDDVVMRINSGVCRIIGRTVWHGGAVIDDNIMIAFDYHNHFYRFDNGERIRSLLTPEYYYEGWNLNDVSPSVTRSRAADPRVSDFANFVDIQGAFMFVPVGPQKPYRYQYIGLHHQLHAKKLKMIGYEELDKGLVRVKVEFPHPENCPPPIPSAEFIVDTINGYTVPRIEYACGYVMDTSWANINNTWVPTAYVLKTDQNFGVEWRIEWESVNEKVDPKLFTVEDMVSDVKEVVPLFTKELGPSLQIGIVGADTPPFEFEYLNKKPSHWFSNTLFYLGCLFTLIALSKTIYDWWRKRNKKDP